MLILVKIFFSLSVLYLGYCAGYMLVLSIAGKFLRKKIKPLYRVTKFRKFAILVPAYKEDDVILSSILSYTKIRYPDECFDIFVIADQLKETTLLSLKNTRANIILVNFQKSSKANAINYAFQVIPDGYDIALICDADNVLHPDFLRFVNEDFDAGFLAVQGQRVAKNLDSPYAVFDATSEMVNNHMFRAGNTAMGCSSAIIGSGMAFDYRIIKEIFREIKVLSGFDKLLQFLLLKHGIKIFYDNRAVVYDEKVSQPIVLAKQRRRWIFSQFHFLFNHISSSFRELSNGNVDYFHLAFLQAIILPRSFLLLLFFLNISISLFLLHISPLFLYIFILELVVFLFAIFISLPVSFFRKFILPNLTYLPRMIFTMFIALFHSHKAKYEFFHTKHVQVGINNPLYEYE